MNKKRKIIFISIIIIIITTAVIGFLYYQSTKPKEKYTQKSIQIPPPKIPVEVSQKPTIKLNIGKTSFSFPDKLPLLLQDKKTPLDESFVYNIAKNLDFDLEPKVSKDVRYGNIYIWNKDDTSLVINPNLRKVEYYSTSTGQQNPSNVINKQLSENSMITLAKEFLNNNFGIEFDSINFSNIEYLESELGTEGLVTTTKEKATIVQINFSPSVSEFPIITLNPIKTTYNVFLLKDGSIYGSTAILPNPLRLGEISILLKNYEEFVNSVNKSIVISLYDGNINLSDLKENSITSIDIGYVSLAYLYDDSKSEYFQPVFILKGKADVVDYEQPLNIVMYLPAVSQKN